jgi:hypothetical protein
MKYTELAMDQAGRPQGKYQRLSRKHLPVLRHYPNGYDPGTGFDSRRGGLGYNRLGLLHVIIPGRAFLEKRFYSFAPYVRQFDPLWNPAPAIGEHQPEQSNTQQ